MTSVADPGIKWNEKADAAVKRLKEIISTEPVVQTWRPDQPCTVFCDASDHSVGSCLMQVGPDNIPHVVAYASKVLNKSQRNFSTIEKELYAILTAVTQHYQSYLYGHPEVTIKTDSKSLCWLLRLKDPSSRLDRWTTRLLQYNLKFEHLRSCENTVADVLSRVVYDEDDDDDGVGKGKRVPTTKKDRQIATVHALKVGIDKTKLNDNLIVSEDFLIDQQEDEELKRIRTLVRRRELNLSPKLTLEQRSEVQSYGLVNDVLCIADHTPEGPRWKIMVPAIRVQRLLWDLHDAEMNGGHFMTDQVKHKVRNRYYWPSWSKDVK